MDLIYIIIKNNVIDTIIILFCQVIMSFHPIHYVSLVTEFHQTLNLQEIISLLCHDTT